MLGFVCICYCRAWLADLVFRPPLLSTPALTHLVQTHLLPPAFIELSVHPCGAFPQFAPVDAVSVCPSLYVDLQDTF